MIFGTAGSRPVFLRKRKRVWQKSLLEFPGIGKNQWKTLTFPILWGKIKQHMSFTLRRRSDF